MGVTKETIAPGNGTDIPRAGDHVAIHYTGALYDPSKKDNHNMGFQYADTMPLPLSNLNSCMRPTLMTEQIRYLEEKRTVEDSHWR